MRKVLVGIVVGLCLLVAAPPASAEETKCRGTIGARTLDNVLVPQGATCTLNGTKVKGTVKVGRNAVLIATDVHVVGNVQGENAKNVVVRRGSFIGGNVQVVQGKWATVAGSRVNFDILYDDNAERVRALNNKVGGNVQAFQNTGGVRIVENRIDGNLQCKANSPKPTGHGNVVQGNKEDQCKKL
jgi:hypothetical protein